MWLFLTSGVAPQTVAAFPLFRNFSSIVCIFYRRSYQPNTSTTVASCLWTQVEHAASP